MTKYRIVFISLLTSLAFGCATSDDVAAVGRAAVNTGLVAASVAAGGSGSLRPENCELAKSEYERNDCQRRNSEIKAARER